MSFSMASLLVHDDRVPAPARAAVSAALAAPPSLRRGLLESAARILHRETDLPCADVRELFALSGGGCG